MSPMLQKDNIENDSGEKGSSQRLLLLVLTLLIAVFAYLYFFTSLIRPQVGGGTPPVTQVVQVKQPIPPRAGQPDIKSGETVTPEAEKNVPPQGGKPGAPAAPVVPPKPEPAPPVTAKPVKSPAQEGPVKTATSVKPVVPVPAKVEPVKTVAPAPAKARQVKPVAKGSEQPIKTVKSGGEKRAAVGIIRKAKKSADKRSTDVYELKINADLAVSEVQPMLTRLKSIGLTTVSLNKTNREMRMHRLFFAAYDRQDAAEAEVNKLLALAPAAFLLFENGKYSVYAGSFLREDKATHERNRLFDKGVKLTVNTARVTVQVVNISLAGHFANRNDAEKTVKRLQKSGVSATVVKAGI